MGATGNVDVAGVRGKVVGAELGTKRKLGNVGELARGGSPMTMEGSRSKRLGRRRLSGGDVKI